MSDPMIRVMERRPVSSGFWVQDFQGGDLVYAEAHPEAGSTVSSAWPVMDRLDAYGVERAVDWILNAASASRDRVARAFRAVYPGSRVESEVLPSDWWGRQFGGVVGIDFSAYFGKDATNAGNRGRGGLVIDTTTSEVDVPGFQARSGSAARGNGPGGGGGVDISTGGGGGGGHGTAGSGASGVDSGGPAVPAETSLAALIAGEYTATSLGMGGSGGNNKSERGGSGGNGYVTISSQNIVYASTRNLRGGSRHRSGSRYGGYSSGGGFYAISRQGFTLAPRASIDLNRGSSSNSSAGQGRLTTFTVDQPSMSGNIQNGVATHFQIYPSVPFGGVHVM